MPVSWRGVTLQHLKLKLYPLRGCVALSFYVSPADRQYNINGLQLSCKKYFAAWYQKKAPVETEAEE